MFLEQFHALPRLYYILVEGVFRKAPMQKSGIKGATTSTKSGSATKYTETLKISVLEGYELPIFESGPEYCEENFIATYQCTKEQIG